MEIIPVGPAQSPNFSLVARDALAYLHKNVGLGMWMVTRVSGDDWILLDIEDNAYGVAAPVVYRWTDSFCSQMVQGYGPRVAPRAAEIPVYAAAPIGQQVPIGAYIGVPLINHDGSLFGTICAIDPHPQPESVRTSLPLVELIATMLSGVLSAEIRASELTRRAEQARIESETDSLTGLYNRRGWDRLLALEESRCQRYGHPACVIAMDLDGLKQINDLQGHSAGDDLISRASSTLKTAIRKKDIAARVGGDEFLILGIECDAAEVERIMKRLRRLTDQAGVSASLGVAKRVPASPLQEAVLEADRAMYEEKRSRKASRLLMATVS